MNSAVVAAHHAHQAAVSVAQQGQAGVGLVLVALSFTAYFLGRFRTARAVLVFIGILMLGVNGWLIAKVAELIVFLEALVGGVAGKALGVTGVAVVAAGVLVLVFLLGHDVHPKHSAGKRTFWIAVTLAVMISAAATPFAALNNLPSTVKQGAGSARVGGA